MPYYIAVVKNTTHETNGIPCYMLSEPLSLDQAKANIEFWSVHEGTHGDSENRVIEIAIPVAQYKVFRDARNAYLDKETIDLIFDLNEMYKQARLKFMKPVTAASVITVPIESDTQSNTRQTRSASI